MDRRNWAAEHHTSPPSPLAMTTIEVASWVAGVLSPCSSITPKRSPNWPSRAQNYPLQAVRFPPFENMARRLSAPQDLYAITAIAFSFLALALSDPFVGDGLAVTRPEFWSSFFSCDERFSLLAFANLRVRRYESLWRRHRRSEDLRLHCTRGGLGVRATTEFPLLCGWGCFG